MNWLNVFFVVLNIAVVSIGVVGFHRTNRRKQTINDLEIRFHKDANVFGEHGTISVTHVRQGLVESTVRFVIVGLTTPPNLSKEVFNLIWEAAKAQGYIPHHLVTYGRDNDIVSRFPGAVLNDDAKLFIMTADLISAGLPIPEAQSLARATTSLQSRKGAENATQSN